MWRKLKGNKSTQLARRLVFFDCETRDASPENPEYEQHELWFGVARTGRIEGRGSELKLTRRHERVFYSREEYWKWLRSFTRAKETTWVYAHNMGFDATIVGLWDELREGRIKLSKPRWFRKPKTKRKIWQGLMVIDDPPTILGCEDENGARMVFCDTLNYWRTTAAQLGKSVGLEKLDFPEMDAPFEEWLVYCRRDVEIIEMAIVELLRWWSENDLGNWRWTAPGLAMSAFRHRFMPHPPVFHDRFDVRKMERNAYYGGQLEAYRLGHIEQPCYQFDVTSLYPFVMRNNGCPRVLKSWNTQPIWTKGEPPFEPAESIAEVELGSTRDTFPVRNDSGVFYCRGPGVAWLAGPELQFAYEKGYVQRLGRWSTYKLAPLFTEYVDFFYGLKNQYDVEGLDVQRTFVKLLLNSLYGKFGQKGGSWQYQEGAIPLWRFGEFLEVNPVSRQFVRHLSLWDIVLKWKPDQETDNAFPAIASFVTSYARQHMRRLKEIAGVGNYFYMSTDSLMVSEQGRDNLAAAGEIHDNRLGGLKLEKQAPTAWIGGLHWYRIGDKMVEGSKKASAVPIDERSWSELQFDSLKTALDRNGKPQIHIRRVEKTRKEGYTKGDVGLDGWISPLALSAVS